MHAISWKEQAGLVCAPLPLHSLPLAALSEGRTGVISPAPVLQALAWHCWSLDHQQQVGPLPFLPHSISFHLSSSYAATSLQDAHELYHVFLTTLSEEMVRVCPPPPPPSSSQLPSLSQESCPSLLDGASYLLQVRWHMRAIALTTRIQYSVKHVLTGTYRAPQCGLHQSR